MPRRATGSQGSNGGSRLVVLEHLETRAWLSVSTDPWVLPSGSAASWPPRLGGLAELMRLKQTRFRISLVLVFALTRMNEHERKMFYVKLDFLLDDSLYLDNFFRTGQLYYDRWHIESGYETGSSPYGCGNEDRQ